MVQSRTVSFLIKLWFEEEAGRVAWHGIITLISPENRQTVWENRPVLENQPGPLDRRAVRSLAAIEQFIRASLRARGVRFGPQAWLGRYYQQVMEFFKPA